MERLGPLVRISKVKPLDRFRVHLEFEDGTQKDVLYYNLTPAWMETEQELAR